MSTATATLTSFLLDRFTEDEEVARSATRGPWELDDDTYPESICSQAGVKPIAGGRWGGEASVFESVADALHVARFNPARVLAECEAKRAIVDWAGPGDPWEFDGRTVLYALAQPYADHPEFREEWRL